MIKYIIIGTVITIILIWAITKKYKSIARKRKREQDIQRRHEEQRLRQIEEQRQAEERRRIIGEKIQAGTIIITKKVNWNAYESVLSANNINELYHFTDKANIESILNYGGLYSWDYLERNNISIPKPGGNLSSRELDRRKNLQNYVRICFIKDHPMLFIAKRDGRIEREVILKINKEVVYWPRTKFSDINAATEREPVYIGETVDHLRKINFGVFNKSYFDLDYLGKMQFQAEVLAFEKIPINYILNIHDFC